MIPDALADRLAQSCLPPLVVGVKAGRACQSESMEPPSVLQHIVKLAHSPRSSDHHVDPWLRQDPQQNRRDHRQGLRSAQSPQLMRPAARRLVAKQHVAPAHVPFSQHGKTLASRIAAEQPLLERGGDAACATTICRARRQDISRLSQGVEVHLMRHASATRDVGQDLLRAKIADADQARKASGLQVSQCP